MSFSIAHLTLRGVGCQKPLGGIPFEVFKRSLKMVSRTFEERSLESSRSAERLYQRGETKGDFRSTPHQFNEITSPGAYLAQWSGHLIRVPEEAVHGHSPSIQIKAQESLSVIKLSDNPYIPVSAARMIAADMDLQPNF